MGSHLLVLTFDHVTQKSASYINFLNVPVLGICGVFVQNVSTDGQSDRHTDGLQCGLLEGGLMQNVQSYLTTCH